MIRRILTALQRFGRVTLNAPTLTPPDLDPPREALRKDVERVGNDYKRVTGHGKKHDDCGLSFLGGEGDWSGIAEGDNW